MANVHPTCLVSICMPTYNGSKYLRQAIESALSQTYTRIELLIVDDDSRDDTLNIAQEFARHDSRVKIHRNAKRLGLAGNWNRCLDLAQGEWIKFLFQDDYLTPTCVEQMLELSLQSGAILAACGRHVLFEPEVSEQFKTDFTKYIAENSLSQRFPNRPTHIPSTEFAYHVTQYPIDNCVGEPTAVMFHRSAVQRFGYFVSELVQITDWEYWMRIAVNAGICYLPDNLATFRLHGRATSMLNQAENAFRSVVLDPLIIYHEMVYNRSYAPLRRTAKSNLPRTDLKRNLFVHYRYAQSIVNKHSEQTNGSKAAKNNVEMEWKRVLSKYPRLGLLPLICLPMRIGGQASSSFRTISRRLRGRRAS